MLRKEHCGVTMQQSMGLYRAVNRMLRYVPRNRLVLLTICVIGYTLFSSMSRKKAVDPKIFEQMILERGRIVIDRFCGARDDCYEITDVPNRRADGVLVVRRDLVPTKILTAALTQVLLQVPSELSADTIDTSKWSINKQAIMSPYNTLIVSFGFMIEALQFGRGHNRILNFGLGGGAIQNYLSTIKNNNIDVITVEIDPQMVATAVKNFGLIETKTNRVVIGDGILYANTLHNLGEFFDYVVVDACSNDKERNVICPIEGFRDEKMVELMAKLVNPGGAIVVNILAYQDVPQQEEKILNLFADYFTSCTLMRIFNNQRMLLCSHRVNWTWRLQKDRFITNLETHGQRLGITTKEYVVSLNP